MKLLPDIVQVNIYGQTLSQLLQRGINIPRLLSKLGLEECVVFDVPRLAKNKEIDDISLQSSIILSEAYQPAKNDVVRQPAQEYHQYDKKWPRCSTPLHSIDGLLDCSYSTIDNDETTANLNIEMLCLDSIPEMDEEDSTIEIRKKGSTLCLVPTVETDDNIIAHNTKKIISDLLSHLVNEVDEEFNFYHAENDNYFKNEVFNIESINTTTLQIDEPVLDENIQLNILNRENSMEIISDFLNDLLNKVEEKRGEDDKEFMNEVSVYEEYNSILGDPSFDDFQYQSFDQPDNVQTPTKVVKKRIKKPITADTKTIKCCHKGCKRSIMLRYGYGRDRLLNHVRTHIDKGRLCYKCKKCDYTHPRPATIREHHTAVHLNYKWEGAEKVEGSEDFQKLLELFRVCFPGWDAKVRIDSYTSYNVPAAVAHNKYLGVESFIKFNKKHYANQR